MIKIKIKFFAYFREVFGAREIELVVEKGITLPDLLNLLAKTPQQKTELFAGSQLKPQVVMMVNGSVVAAESLSSRRLEEDAVVAIFPLMGGG